MIKPNEHHACDNGIPSIFSLIARESMLNDHHGPNCADDDAHSDATREEEKPILVADKV